MNFDILIKNAKIMDGSGNPWFYGNVGICGDKIVYIGKSPAKCMGIIEIDATNKVLAPGFIDSHTHFDLGPFKFIDFEDHYLTRRLYQGITTQITGCCGTSPAPVTRESKTSWLEGDLGLENLDKANWYSFKEYLDELDKCELGTNIASYVGHGTIRHNILGFSDKLPNEEEMEKMRSILKQAMEDGAIGISTGLIYPPGVFSNTNELINLCSVLTEYNGIYASHMRSESSNWLEAVQEVIEIAEINHIPGQMHHIKIKHENSSELVQKFFEIVNNARKRNVDITFEQYPYEASWTGLSAVLPPWLYEGGDEKTLERLKDENLYHKILSGIYEDYGWVNLEDELEGSKKMLVLNGNNCDNYAGKTIYEIAEEIGVNPMKAAIKILIESKLSATCAYFGMKEEDIKNLMKSSYTMIGSDSIASRRDRSVHPRNNGTFPRVLGNYAREKQVISMEMAVNKMTGFPAQRFNFPNRGLIREGFFADLVIFDENTVLDQATYTEPFNKPVGIDYVIVNGCISIADGEFTGKVNGHVLRR